MEQHFALLLQPSSSNYSIAQVIPRQICTLKFIEICALNGDILHYFFIEYQVNTEDLNKLYCTLPAIENEQNLIAPVDMF